MENTLPPAIFLLGPTASGKTALSVDLAGKINGEIISVDSTLIYKGMDIGTAKPTLEERRGIPHHLIDIMDPAETYSTGRFRKDALAIMQDISGRGKIPLLTGGTMLYFNALFNGLAELPSADAELRARLEQEMDELGKQAMHDRLAAVDPESAQRIHPNDPQRIQRALEVYELSGKPISHFFQQAQQQTLPFNIIKLIVAPEDRKELHAKIATRFRLMVSQGLIDEVENLYQRGDLSLQMPAIRAVGYRQVWSYLQGDYDQETMIEKAIIATRQLAKRQYTWLRRETDALAFVSFQQDLAEKVFLTIEQQL